MAPTCECQRAWPTHSGDESLAKLIPPQIFEVIKAKQLFGWGQKRAAVTV